MWGPQILRHPRSNIDSHMSVCSSPLSMTISGRLTCCRTLSSPPLQNENVVMHKYPQQRGKHGNGWKSTPKHLPCIKPGKICSLNVLYACACTHTLPQHSYKPRGNEFLRQAIICHSHRESILDGRLIEFPHRCTQVSETWKARCV